MSGLAGESGMTLTELIIAAAVISVLAAVAVPGLLRARVTGAEASAVGALRAINSAQASYSSSCAAGGYAVDLADLAKPPAGSTQGFISPDLSSNGVVKSGYEIALERDGSAGTQDVSSVTCNASASTPATSYFAAATPFDRSAAGGRYFATDTKGTIVYDSALAVPNPIPAGSTTVQ